jgi:hypothetical protein
MIIDGQVYRGAALMVLWVAPFVFLFGGKELRRRLRYALKARAWWRNEDGVGSTDIADAILYQMEESILHIKGQCSNFSWCIRARLDPDYRFDVPVPEFLTEEEVTQGWFLA